MKIRLSIERDLAQIENVGDCVKCLFERDDQPATIQMDLMLAELLTNIIKHSSPGNNEWCEFPVGVTVVVEDDVITLSVSEVGKPISHDVVRLYTETEVNMPSNDGAMVDLPESGWGVQLIKSLCDDISYERVGGSNVFRLCFDLNALAA